MLGAKGAPPLTVKLLGSKLVLTFYYVHDW